MTALLGVGGCQNFSNYKAEDTSYVKLIQSNARGHDQVKVIFDSYTKVSSRKESTPYRGNSKGMRSNIVDDTTCIRLLYLAQNVFATRTAEKLVTVTRNDVKTNSDYLVTVTRNDVKTNSDYLVTVTRNDVKTNSDYLVTVTRNDVKTNSDYLVTVTRNDVKTNSDCLVTVTRNDVKTNSHCLVTVTRNDVKTNSDCLVSTGMSRPKDANSRMIQHIVEVAEIY